jgi:NAD(P)-dependent dehydrogenase (short-subunit alcohol dehydrogenase family)
MVGRLHEKVALVVGAGSVGPGWGNGKAAAVLFAREGAKVLCGDVNEDAAKETVEIIRQENGTANAICADVTTSVEWSRRARTFMDGSMSSITTSASLMSEASWNCLKRSGTEYSP